MEPALQPDAARWTLPGFLDDVAERHGSRPALDFGGRTYGYEEVRSESLRVARGLVARGVGKGTRVGLLFANRPEWVFAAFGVSLAGGVTVPVNTFATPDERDYILRHGDVCWLLGQATLHKRDFAAELHASYPELAAAEPGAARIPRLPFLRGASLLGGDARGALESHDALLADAERVDEALVLERASEVTPGDDALIIYTSGTTDRPKGIVHMQRAPVLQSWRFAEYMGITAEDRVFTAQPFFWTAGICMSLGASLAGGAKLFLEETFDPGAALRTIARERITTLHAWPHQEKAMAEHEAAAGTALGSLRHVEFSSPLAPLIPLEKDLWGMYAAYGLSETFTLACAVPADTPAEIRHRTHGKPLPGIDLRIVDPETGDALPIGEKGEIAVKGATFMRGYYKVPLEQTVDAAGYFRTGDGGALDEEGYLHWSGRLTNLIKTGGANVSPLEIEGAALEIPGLVAAAAVGVPHPTLGEAVVLAAVPTGEEAPDAKAVVIALRERLSAYKVPRVVLFFARDEVEFTGTQKIQLEPLREAIRKRLADERVEIAGHAYGD